MCLVDSICCAEGLVIVHRRLSRECTARILCLMIGMASMGQSVTVLATEGNEISDKGEFDSQFLRGLGQDVDLSRYARESRVIPGDYELDVLINGKDLLRQRVTVTEEDSSVEQHICFSRGEVESWGVPVERLPNQQNVAEILASDCIVVEELIPGATFSMDMASLRGDLSIPQAYAGTVKRGYVDPSEWDDGINAIILGYHANAFHNNPDSGDSSTDYNVNLNAGMNVSGWRLRHNGNYHYNDTNEVSDYTTQNTYAQTDIDRLRAKLTLGAYFTPGSEFDSIPFKGVQLGSDTSMLPESERGYAPVIRGTADTNARVTVRQDGNVIYETSVSPGAFVIDDLYATGYAGDLEVAVRETDGSEKSFTVPYASVVQMLRPGASRFNVIAGQYDDSELDDAPNFAQATYRHGISNIITAYGGGLVAEDYSSALVGTAFGTPVGAVALDVTLSHADEIPYTEKQLDGQSYRLSYSKMFNATGTNFSLATYRFSSEDYLSFSDFAQVREGNISSNSLRERSRYQITVSQSLGEVGNVNFSGLKRDYWSEKIDNTTYQLSYSRSFHWGSINLSATRNTEDYEEVNTYMLTANIPIGDSGTNHPTMSTTATFDDNDVHSVRTNLSGTMGENSQLNYNVYASQTVNNDYDTHSVGGDINYRTSASELGATYSHSDDVDQYSVSATGTVVAYADGVVFSPDRAETMALIHADGAAGASLSNGMGNRLDDDGEAIDSGLTPYRHNTVAISPKGLPVDVELEATSRTVTPRRGAVVRVDYATRTGKPMLLHIQDGAVPFGAEVVDGNGDYVSLVGQGQVIFLRGDHDGLRVVWGEDSDQSCLLQYQLPRGDDQTITNYQRIEASCTVE